MKKKNVEGGLDLKAENECVNTTRLFDKLIWNVDEVAEAISVSKGHVYNLVSQRRIPHEKKGKRLYFIPSEILNWIKEGNYD